MRTIRSTQQSGTRQAGALIAGYAAPSLATTQQSLLVEFVAPGADHTPPHEYIVSPHHIAQKVHTITRWPDKLFVRVHTQAQALPCKRLYGGHLRPQPRYAITEQYQVVDVAQIPFDF